MRRIVLTAAFVLSCVACGRPERSGGGAAGAAGDAADSPANANVPATAPDPTGPFVRFEAGGVPAYTLERERGVGVITLDPGPRLAGRVADTLEARNRPLGSAGVLARLVLDTTGVFTFEARDGLLKTPGALDFGYEETGLPIVEHGTDGWERVLLGSAADGSAVTGWARARQGVVGVTLWQDLIPGQPLFFALPPDSIRFFAAANGAEKTFTVRPDDYILWPLAVQGDWMRVRAVSPSDYCATPGPPGAPPAGVVKQDTVWIRWRGAEGRPRVWFFTRGC